LFTGIQLEAKAKKCHKGRLFGSCIESECKRTANVQHLMRLEIRSDCKLDEEQGDEMMKKQGPVAVTKVPVALFPCIIIIFCPAVFNNLRFCIQCERLTSAIMYTVSVCLFKI
jgi:hypothetical protein